MRFSCATACGLCIVRNVNGTYAYLQEHLDPALSLRVRMMLNDMSVTDVCQLIDRKRVTVSRYRMGQTPIPVDVARQLHDAGLLHPEALATIESRSA